MCDRNLSTKIFEKVSGSANGSSNRRTLGNKIGMEGALGETLGSKNDLHPRMEKSVDAGKHKRMDSLRTSSSPLVETALRDTKVLVDEFAYYNLTMYLLLRLT